MDIVPETGALHGRVLNFPDHRTIEVVYVRPSAPHGFGYGDRPYEDWGLLSDATGTMVIPEGQSVPLVVSHAAPDRLAGSGPARSPN